MSLKNCTDPCITDRPGLLVALMPSCTEQLNWMGGTIANQTAKQYGIHKRMSGKEAKEARGKASTHMYIDTQCDAHVCPSCGTKEEGRGGTGRPT